MKDLVIWRVSDRVEVARAPIDSESGKAIQWSSTGNLVAAEGRIPTVFRWQGEQLVAFPIWTEKEVDQIWLDLDADSKVELLSSGKMRVCRLSSGSQEPLKWRFRKGVKPISHFWSFNLQPSRTKRLSRKLRQRGSVRGVVVQEDSPPTLTPIAIPTPSPARTYSPEQKRFFKEHQKFMQQMRRMDEEDSKDPLLAPDVRHMNEKVETHAQEEFAARAYQLFPELRGEAAFQPAVPDYVKVTLWDLQKSRVVWQRVMPVEESSCRASWSPDGKILAILGTYRRFEGVGDVDWEARGIEFLDGATGKVLGSSALKHASFAYPGTQPVWMSGPVLALKDTDNYQWEVLRQFDPTNGALLSTHSLKNIGHALPRDKTVMMGRLGRIDRVTVDASGSHWGFAWDTHGWRVLSESQIQDLPLVQPTPAPKPS